MSIFFDFNVGASGRRFRRAIEDDVNDVLAFSNSQDESLFGEVNIGRLMYEKKSL